MADYIGARFGNYHLTQRIGQGGFADVYLGEHVRLGRKAAIKILHTHLIGDDIRLFQQEAQIIAGLKHPHIIRLLDFDVQEGTPFLVLDYAPHGSLRQKYPPQTRLPLPLLVDYVRQVASALQYAHEQKLIHRDVKPENMLLDEQEQIVLSDFGIATIAHATSSMSTQASMGTLAYMAPEQIQGKARPASDQYALAVTIYSWLAGTPPFRGSSTEVIAQHLGGAAPSLRAQGVQVSPNVEQVVLTALAKDPAARFGSVQAFANALAYASGVASPSVQPPLASSSPARPEYAPTALATPQTHTTSANTPPAVLPPTIPATPQAAQFVHPFLQPAKVAPSSWLRRLPKPWVIAAASEIAVPLVFFLIMLTASILVDRFRSLFLSHFTFFVQLPQIYDFFFLFKLAFLGDPTCGFATGDTTVSSFNGHVTGTLPAGSLVCNVSAPLQPVTLGNIFPLLFPHYALTFLPLLICIIVALVVGFLLVRRTSELRPGVIASLQACLCYLGAVLVLLAISVAYEFQQMNQIGLGGDVIPDSSMILGLCAYGFLSIGLSAAFAALGGLLGRKFAQPMPAALAMEGVSAGINNAGQGETIQYTQPSSTEPSPAMAQSAQSSSAGPSPEITNLAAQYQLGQLQVSTASSEGGRRWLGGLAGVLAIGSLVLGLSSPYAVVIVFWLLGALVLGGLSAYALTYTARHGVHRVFLFARGLIDTEGTTTRVFPWDRIAEVKIMSTINRRYGTRSVVYVIQRDDDLKIQLTSMDFGTTNADFLQATINEAVVRVQLPRAMQALQTGQDLTFGPITVNAREIGTAHRRLPWSEVGNITVENGFLYVLKPGQMKMLSLSTAVMEIPNLAVLLKLADSVKQPS